MQYCYWNSRFSAEETQAVAKWQTRAREPETARARGQQPTAARPKRGERQEERKASSRIAKTC
eukprot:2630044-Pleurochrysis_carterae.AAC.3